ncbi:P-loop NTPase family protein [Acaryochloris marina]|uniref:hypothetical protein n=1 Tax=Acaryochloris marina TaxID=155978 RepID=UPI0021C400E2|nr:hypothetical protein [Acaryochloris marina]BDM81230.1 topology modulation protein [Acaryochloris marina MBIC10699]
MKKVAIIGSSGAGKSTLARQLGHAFGLKVIHLDQVYWQPGWLDPDPQTWRQQINALVAEPNWIMDGNYSGTFDLILPPADTIIFLDFSRWRCLGRVLKRLWQYRGQTRPDMAPDCPERFNWEFLWFVWGFPQHHRSTILQALAKLPSQTVVTLQNPQAVQQFLSQFQPRSSSQLDG